jgi:hypothetical protein
MWNGFTKDCENAASVSKETWTDDRIWCPSLIRQRYGVKKKNRFQILAENYNDKTLKRFQEIFQICQSAGQQTLLKKELDSWDMDGETALTASIKANSMELLQYLVGNGCNPNRMNKKGRTPVELVRELIKENDKDRRDRCPLKSLKNLRFKRMLTYLEGLNVAPVAFQELPRDPPKKYSYRRHIDIVNQDYIPHHYFINLNEHVVHYYSLYGIEIKVSGKKKEEKKKPDGWVKSSLYKQRYGGR